MQRRKASLSHSSKKIKLRSERGLSDNTTVQSSYQNPNDCDKTTGDQNPPKLQKFQEIIKSALPSLTKYKVILSSQVASDSQVEIKSGDSDELDIIQDFGEFTNVNNHVASIKSDSFDEEVAYGNKELQTEDSSGKSSESVDNQMESDREPLQYAAIARKSLPSTILSRSKKTQASGNDSSPLRKRTHQEMLEESQKDLGMDIPIIILTPCILKKR